MNQETQGKITKLLLEIRGGSTRAKEDLLELLVSELRHVARNLLRRERRAVSLTPTELVNESYIKLWGKKDLDADNRRYLFAAAGRAMRQVLVDHYRTQHAAKRPNPDARVSSDVLRSKGVAPAVRPEYLDLHLAVEQLDEWNSALGEVVYLKLYWEMTHGEIADHLGLSEKAIEKRWGKARGVLRAMLAGAGE